MTDVVNVSQDLVWELTRGYNSYLVKRTVGNNTISFSRDPLNLQNIPSRKNSSLRNDKAIGLAPTKEGGVSLITKKSAEKYGNKPAQLYRTTTWGPYVHNRKLFRGIVNSTVARGYRADLRKSVVVHASAIRQSQRPKKEKKVTRKPRGKKAKAAAAAAAEKA